MAGKSTILNDFTNTILTRSSKSSLGVDNSSSLGSWGIENETLLSQNSDISLKKIVGEKSFIEKVKQSFNTTEISVAFPRKSLNNEKLKRKKRGSSFSLLDTIKSPSKSSLSITESLQSPSRNLRKRKCNVDLSFSKSASDSFSNGLDSGTVDQESVALNKPNKRRVSVHVKYDSTTFSNHTVTKDSGKEMSHALEEHSNVSNLENKDTSEKNFKKYSGNVSNDIALNEKNLINSRRSSMRLREKQTNLNSSNIQNDNPVNHNTSLRNTTGEEISIKEDLNIDEQVVFIKKQEESDGSDFGNSDESNKSQTNKSYLRQKQHDMTFVLGYSQPSVLDYSQLNPIVVEQNTGNDDNPNKSLRQLSNNSTYTLETHNSIIKNEPIGQDPISLDSCSHHSTHLDKSSNEKSLLSNQMVPELLFHNENDIIASNSVMMKSGVGEINPRNESRNKLNESIQRNLPQENTNSLQISDAVNIESEKMLHCTIKSNLIEESSRSDNGADLDPHEDDFAKQNAHNGSIKRITSRSINKNISEKESNCERSNETSLNIEPDETVVNNMPLNKQSETSMCLNKDKSSLSDITPSKNKLIPIGNSRKSLSNCYSEINNVKMVTGFESNILNAAISMENTEISEKENSVNCELTKYNGEVSNIKVRRSLRRSVTFANTARFKSDSQSGEISIPLSPTAKEPDNPCSSGNSKEPQNAVDSEHSTSKNNIGFCQQSMQKSCNVEKEVIEHKNNTKCIEENNDNLICPEKRFVNEKRILELNETNRKRKSMEERSPLKHKRPSEKTINELSYDTYSDVSEIPLDKTIVQKKLIYHSTPKYSVLDKRLSSNQSIKRSLRLQKSCKDQVIQVSKSIFGTSSEVTSGRKTSKELSTSYSFQQKVVQSKRKRSSSKNNTVKTSDQQCKSSSLSPSSSLFSPTISKKYYSSSDGNKASNEDSSANKFIPTVISTLTNSLGSSLQYQTKKTVCFKDYSTHVEYTNQTSTQGSSGFKTSECSLYTPMVTCSIRENSSRNDTSGPQMIEEPSESSSRCQSSKHTLSPSQVPVDSVSSKPISECSIATLDLRSILTYGNLHKKLIKNKKLDESQFFHKDSNSKCRYDYENDERFMIGYSSYKPPSAKFPDKWVHPDLLKFICTKLTEKYDSLESKVIGHKIITLLCATVSAVDRLENQIDIEASTLLLKNLLCKYEICVNVMEYCMFIYRFTPFNFQRKILTQKGKLFHSKAGSSIITPSEKIPIK